MRIRAKSDICGTRLLSSMLLSFIVELNHEFHELNVLLKIQQVQFGPMVYM